MRPTAQPYAVVAALGARAHGLVTRTQLSEHDVSPRQIQYWRNEGLLTCVEPSVYLLAGHQLSWHGRLLAPCLESGAIVSHRAAGALHHLDGCRPGKPEITVPRWQTYRRPGVITHESTDLHLVQPVFIDGIPTTPVARTVLDLGAVVPRRVEWAMFSALDQQLTTWKELLITLVTHSRRGRRGCGPLRKLLDLHYGDRSESQPERFFLRIVTEAGLLLPVQQLEVYDADGFIMRVDFAYPDLKIAIEIDGAAYHNNSKAFELDPVKRNRLKLAGWLLLEFTARRLRDHPVEVCEEVARAIRIRSAAS